MYDIVLSVLIEIGGEELSAPRGETETEREEVTLETLRERQLGIRDDSTSYRFERTRIHRVIARVRSRIKGDGPMEEITGDGDLHVLGIIS